MLLEAHNACILELGHVKQLLRLLCLHNARSIAPANWFSSDLTLPLSVWLVWVLQDVQR